MNFVNLQLRPHTKSKITDCLSHHFHNENSKFLITTKYYKAEFSIPTSECDTYEIAIIEADNFDNITSMQKYIEEQTTPLKIIVMDKMNEKIVELCMEHNMSFINMDDDEWSSDLCDIFQCHSWSTTLQPEEEAEEKGEKDDFEEMLGNLSMLREQCKSLPRDQRLDMAEKIALRLAKLLESEE